jgi:hypothetical protein
VTLNRVKIITPFDPFSEIGLGAENDDYPRVDFTQMQFEGTVDIAALSEAYSEAVNLVPIFCSHFKDERKGLTYFPVWIRNTEVPNSLQIVDCRNMVREPFDPMEFSTEYYALRMRRRIDLTGEFPFSASLLQIADNKYIFSVVYHHSALDPSKAYLVFTHMLSAYHEKVKGEKPEWADSIGMAALKRSGGFIKPMPMMKYLKDQAYITWIKYGPGVIRHIASEDFRDYRQVKGRHSLRAVIDDPRIIRGLFSRAKRNNATLNDLIFAVARKVLTQWNDEHDTDSDHFRFGLITSLKGRMDLPENAGAGISVINLISSRQDGLDIDLLTGLFRDLRIAQLRDGTDIRFYGIVREMVRALRLFPLYIRKRFLHIFSLSSPITFYLSNLGVVWPRFKDGRPTSESAILSAGDFVINDFHSSPSIGRGIGFGMTLRSHNQRLYINFVCDRFRFRKHEAQELAKRLVDGLIDAV